MIPVQESFFHVLTAHEQSFTVTRSSTSPLSQPSPPREDDPQVTEVITHSDTRETSDQSVKDDVIHPTEVQSPSSDEQDVTSGPGAVSSDKESSSASEQRNLVEGVARSLPVPTPAATVPLKRSLPDSSTVSEEATKLKKQRSSSPPLSTSSIDRRAPIDTPRPVTVRDFAGSSDPSQGEKGRADTRAASKQRAIPSATRRESNIAPWMTERHVQAILRETEEEKREGASAVSREAPVPGPTTSRRPPASATPVQVRARDAAGPSRVSASSQS